MGIQERKARERSRRRQQILVAAKRIFSVKGFTKTTMEDIAEGAELSPGTIYLYFKNKDELFASLTLRILRYLLIRIESINAESHLEPEQRLDLLRQAMLDAYEFDPMTLANLFHLQAGETLKHLSTQLLTEIRDSLQSVLNAMAAIFEAGIKKGLLADQAPVALSDICWALFSGMVLREVSKADNENDLRKNFDFAFRIFRQGIAAAA